jgi:hypothetical protein
MIRRPTDLKTIKAAIGAGAKAFNTASAAAAAASDDTDAAAATALLLPWSVDLVPPRAIVNSAQLERELMRMFANAVMFNPGEDDVVRDSREMFDDAVVKLVNFREAEKGAEQVVRDQVATPVAAGTMEVEREDEDTPPVLGKRRKIG